MTDIQYDPDLQDQRIAALEAQVTQLSQYPHLGLNVEPTGATFVIALGPANAITQSIPEESMNEICGRWLETRKDIKHQLSIVRDGK